MAYDSIKQFADRVKEIQAGTYQSSGGQKNTKTSYQQNLSVPAQTVSNNNYTTSRDVYSRIWEIGQTDPERAKKAVVDFVTLQNDPSSQFYNPYRKHTNKSVDNLSALGIDTSNIDDDWFTNTAYLENYLSYNGTTNAPSSPKKNASAEEKAAYERNQIGKANDLTKQAQNEWAALQEELTYWAKDSGRNYSDDEIIEKIYGKNNENLAKKYPVLARMENSLQTGKDILELNSPINYSKDNAYTTIWRARNDGGTGDWDIDALLDASGQYNSYVEDPDITARLTENTPTYAPWTVGSTMDDVCVYYNKPNFTSEEIAQMKPDGSDDTEAKMWNRLYEADQFTIEAEDQAAKFDELLEKKLKSADNYEDVMEWVDRRLKEDRFSSLKALDNSTNRVNDLIDTTRPINFSRYDVEQKVRQRCEENANKLNPVETVANSTLEPGEAGALTPQEIENVKAEDRNIRDASEIGEGSFTDAENSVLQNAGSSVWGFMRNLYSTAMDGLDKTKRMVQANTDDAAKGYVQDYLPVVVEVAKYNTMSDAYDRDRAELAEYQRRFGNLADYYDEFEEQKQVPLDDGTSVYMHYDPSTESYVLDSIGMLVPEEFELYDEGSAEHQLLQQALQIAKDESARAKDIRYAHARLQYGGKDIQAEIERYGQLNAQVQRENEYLRTHDLQYDEGQKAIDHAEKEMAVLGLAGRFLGADTSGLDYARAMVDYFSGFGDEPQRPNNDSTYLERLTATIGAFGGEATPEVISNSIHAGEEEARNNIQLAQEMLAYADEYDLQLPDNFRRNMEYQIEDWQKELQGLEYAEILVDTDPAEIDKAVEAGRAFEEKYEGNMHYWTELFNEAGDFYTLKYQDRYTDPDGNTYRDIVSEDDEKTYYYLLGKKVLEMGEDLDPALGQIGVNPDATREAVREIFSDAKAYQQFMEDDVWKNREYNASVEYGRKLAQETPVLANLAGTLVTPAESVTSFLEILDKAVFGGRFDSQSFAGRLAGAKNAIREETKASIDKAFGKDTIASKIANIGYEIYCNRGDSTMNMLAFGWMTGGLGGIAGEFIGSAPMGFTAALSAAAEAVENGASTDQAWLIAGITFLAETGTEAITLSNIKEAFGTTEGLTKESVKGFLKDWLTKDGLEEVFGEVTNNILERAAETWAANLEDNDYQNTHKLRVDKYLSEGKGPDEAEQLATMEELQDDLHTAIVSYLSAGTGVIVQTGKAAVNTTNYYRTATRAAQQAGDPRSMLRHMLDDHQAARAAGNQPGIVTTTTTTQGNQEAETGFEVEDVDIEFPAAQETADVEPLVAAEQQAEQQAKTEQETQYAKDIEVLTSAMKSGAVSSETAGVAAMLSMGGSDASVDQANAAAVTAGTVFEGGISEIRDIIVGGAQAGTDNNAVKIGIMQAILGGEDSESYQMIQSEDFQNATNEQKAEMLAQTGEADNQNPNVRQFVNNRIREIRLAEQTRDALAKGAAKASVEARAEAEQAASDAYDANEQLEVRQSETKAADDSRVAAANEALQNPSDENVKQADQANQKFMAAVAVEQEYEQSVKKAEEKKAEAEKKAQQQLEEDLSAIRGQSNENVAQTDQQREEIAAQREEQRMIREQEAAQAQAEEDQRSGKADEDKTRKVAEDWANVLRYEGADREEFIQRVMDRQEMQKLGKIDLTGKMNNAEGYLAVSAFARKTGLQFELSDTLPEGTRGKYQNGKVYLNANLVRSGTMTIGQALVEASLHEVTHSMENTKNYRNYRKTVLDCLFGAGNDFNQNAYDAAIATKKADYRKAVNQELSTAEAEQEIIADFARTRLADRDVVQRFMDSGLGGKMRNTLHNINQALKNFFGGMTGAERRTAEYLRMAERQYQKALDELARTSAHPEGDQFSVQQLATSMNLGMTYNEETLQLFLPDGTEVDGVTEGHKILPDMIKETPVGMLIEMGLDNTEFEGQDGETHTQQGDARKMFSDLMNLCARYKDNNLIWEIAGSEFAETFSALKSNSDPQYKNTVDFGTICAKTQAIVDVLSGTMQKRIETFKARNAEAKAKWFAEHGTYEGFEPKVFTGLTSKDVMEVYDKTHDAGLSVPCPVCYVFSRWMGVPSLLGQMNRFQNEYVVTAKDENWDVIQDENGDPVIDWDATSEVANDYIHRMLEKYGSKDKIAEKKTSLQNKINNRIKNLPKLRQALGEFQRELNELMGLGELDKSDQKKKKSLEGKIATKERAIEKTIQERDEFTDELREVEGFNWVTQALCLQHTEAKGKVVNDTDENGNYIVDRENFRLTPEEILFDLNRTGEFAGYAKNWKYRTTRGAGMGKAIMPYSGASIGDIINGDAVRWQTAQNPFVQMDKEAAQKAFENAKERVKKQNLVGGQRFQSTSDFRPEWGLDYVMSFLEMQALGSKVQMYTKVAEAVDFLGSIGADVNLSIMARGNGFHEATAEELALAEQDTEEGRELKSRIGTLGGKTYVMEFSDVTGMDYNTAKEKSKKFNNVQMILVGMNDMHIKLAMGNQDIDFIIPWHSSGNSKDVLQQLVASVDETLTESSDYTDTQTDQIKSHKEGKGKSEKTIDDRTESEIKLWEARVKLLSEGGDALTEEDRRVLFANEYTKNLYTRFTAKKGEIGYDPECSGVKLPKSQAEQIFPYEYWDKNSTRENADVNGQRFAEYCDSLGLVPRFSQFKDDPGYWKLLIDRKMYDNNVMNDDGTVKEYGKYRDQKVVDVTKARMDTDASQELDAKEQRKQQVYQLPESTTARYRTKDSYSEETNFAIDEGNSFLEQKYDVSGRYSAYGDVTDADIDMALFGGREPSSLERMTGKPLTDAFKNALERLSRNEDIPLEELQSIYEISFGDSKVRKGFSIDTAITKKYERYSDSYIQDVQAELSPEQVEEQNRIKAVLDSQGSILGLDLKGKLKRGGEVKQGKRVDVVIGLAAAGKSSVADYISYKYQSGFLDSDDVKKEIKGYDNGLGATYTHPESKFINEWREREAIARGDNVILPVLGDDAASLAKRLANYTRVGYNVHLHFVDLPQNKAIGRALSRYNNTGRYIDVALLKSMDPEAIAQSYEYFKGKLGGVISGYTRWDNDVEQGEHPRVIETSDPDETDLFGDIQLLPGLRSESGTDLGEIQSDDGSSAGAGDNNGSGYSELNEGTADEGGAFSTGGEITDADIDQMLTANGLIPDELSTEQAGNLPGMPATDNGSAQRQFGSETAQGSNALHDDVKQYLYRHSDYTPDTNSAQIDRAIAWVRSNANQSDPDGFFASMQQAQNGDFDSISADGQARMLTLMSMAAIKGEQTGDHSSELLLADMFNRQGTEAGRALQARKMFRLMTPVGRMATLEQMENQINEEYGRLGNEHRVHLSQWVLDAAAVAESEEDFNKVRNAAKAELASQMRPNWKEKFTALRMISMLANPRTHIRNLGGNLAFMPAVALKNKIGAAIEATFIDEGDRTKTIGFANPEARAFAKRYAKQIESMLRGESKYNEGNSVQRERKMFGQGDGVVSRTLGQATQFLIDVNGKALEGEDWIFLSRHFRNSFAGYMTANGLTEADMKGDVLDKATAYAVDEAQKATYRDANEIANWMSKVKNPAARFVINAVLPFKKTPMNILKRGVEYSPVSIIRSLTSDAKHLKQWNDYQNGKLSVLPDKAISPTQYIDRLASGISGTAFLAVGALLSSLGFLRSGLDDDEDEFEKINGSQEYSLEIGGVSFTIDWAAPICMPLFVGATIMDTVRKGAEDEGKGISVGSVLDAILGIAEPVTQLSMLDGLNTVLNPSSYGDSDSLVQVGEKVLTNYATSYVPTFFGQIARTIDTTRRKNFVESGADLKVFRSALEQIENKIPFLTQKNIPYRNVWGDADVSSAGWAAIENFLSPGYGNIVKEDIVTNELKRLYQETKDPNMIPKAASKTVSIGGKSTPLTAEQYDQYVVDRGHTAHESIQSLMESPAWQICDDQTRAMMVTDAWTYANQIARHNIDKSIKKDSWVANAEYNGNFVDTAIDRAASSNRKEYISGYGQVMAEALDSNDAEMYDLSIAAMENAEATEAEIRAPLRDYFKPRYQQAFEENDQDTMDEIMEKLLDADAGFKEKDIRSWIPSEDEEEIETDYRWLNEETYNR